MDKFLPQCTIFETKYNPLHDGLERHKRKSGIRKYAGKCDRLCVLGTL